MRTKLIVVLLAFCLVGTFAFASGQQQAPSGSQGQSQGQTQEQQAKPVKLVWSSVSVPADAHTKAMEEFKKVVEQVSGGQIQVELHNSGELYTQEAAQAAIRRGNLDMVYTGPNWLADFVPYMSMFAAPYIFDSYEHMTKTFNGPIGDKIFDDIANKIGIRPLGAYYLGTREVNLRDIGRRVTTPQDMKGVKLRMPNTPTWQFMGKTLGANPTPLSFTEVYLALKTGTIDGQDNPLPTDKNAKFYEVTKYIVLTDHFINPIMPSINEKKWESLTDQQKKWVMQGIDAGRKVCDNTNLQQEKELIQFFKDQGMTIIEPDKAAFKKFALDMVMGNKKMTDSWDMDLYNQVQQLGKSLSN